MLEDLGPGPKRKRLKGLIAGLISLGVIGGLVGGGLFIAYDQVTSFFSKFQVEDYRGDLGPEVEITIESGDDGAAVARKLLESDVIKSFDAIYREMLNSDFTIYPGVYSFPTKMSGAQALQLLIEGKNRITLNMTIPEGYRITQIIAEASKAFDLSAADLEAAVQDIMPRLPDAALNAEGYLFPATYTFDPGVSATEVITKMVDRMEQELAKYSISLKSSFDVVNLAALIQVEAGLPEDFFKVSRVFANRLDKGMLLQSDATVSYGTGGTTVTTTDAQRADDNPYNTYLHAGLPGGPISNPGSLAIEAALRPADGSWLYFVTVNLKTGETVFSNTFAEHEKAAQEFYAWLRANPSWNE